MSLLMDALKKAELAKRQGQGESLGGSGGAAAKSGLALEPIAPPAPAQTAVPESSADNAPGADRLPHLPSHLEELDAQFLAEAANQAASTRLRTPSIAAREPLADPTPPAAAPARSSEQSKPKPAPPRQNDPQPQSAAQNLFASKQAAKPPGQKSFAIAVGALTVLSVCGIGGYFWWQLQPKTSLVASRSSSPPPAPPAPISAPAAVSPAPTLAVAAAATPATSVAGTGRPSVPSSDDKDDDSGAARSSPQGRRAPTPTAPIEAEGPIRVSKTPLKINPALLRGFEAFNRGDLAAAQTEYERAQKADPLNTDTLHGLAAIAVRQSRLDQAESLYRRIVEADPHDTVAMSALINMRRQVDPGMAESRLKTLSADQPGLAAPHFSLGNLYARHERWAEAQQEYFRAYSAEPDNPDIIYNLAISLEHLRQNKLAAQYYAEAIAAAQNRTAGFDKSQAAARLRTLQP